MLEQQQTEKPSHEEWLRWAEVVISRLTTCVHVFSKPPHDTDPESFMPEKERQEKSARTVSLLRRIHTLTDGVSTPTASLAEVAHHDERVIAGLSVLFQDVLNRMPNLSTDMQKLLKSPWFDKCNGRLASELFRGPMGYEPEGIGSGYPEHGRLPEVLQNLLEREQIGDVRRPREDLHRHGSAADHPENGTTEPQRHIEDQRKRWADKNSGFLRSAGRVD